MSEPICNCGHLESEHEPDSGECSPENHCPCAGFEESDDEEDEW